MTKKQKKTLKILACNLALLVLLCLVWAFFLNPKIRFPEEMPVLEKGVSYPAAEFIEETNGKVTPERPYLDTETVGDKTVSYAVKRFLVTKTYEMAYTVVDTTPPVITVLSQEVEWEPGAPYPEEEMRKNIAVDEGELFFTTDYDSAFAGIYTVSVTAVDEAGNRSESHYEVVVGDTEPPTVLRSGSGTVIEVGDSLEIEKVISYGDNADHAPVLETSGNVDIYTPGKYTVHASLTDASGNVTRWDIAVEVVEEIEDEEQSDPPFYPFSQFRQDYAGSGRHFGIDISRWQGDVDFEAVKNAGCEFVIMRIGYSEDGVFEVDKYYRQNMERAKAAGIPVGIYLFSYDNTVEEVKSSVAMMFEELGNISLEMPVVFDWENFSRYQNYQLSFQGLNHLYDVFEDEVTARGYDCMLYGSKYYLQTVWKHTDIRPIWLANFTKQTTYEGQYRIWQASATGKIDGIDGYVDMNILYDDETNHGA